MATKVIAAKSYVVAAAPGSGEVLRAVILQVIQEYIVTTLQTNDGRAIKITYVK